MENVMENVIDLLKSTGIEIKKAAGTHGGEYHVPCPGCGGRDRFHVWPDQNEGQGSYWCRGCGKAGDSIQFLRDFSGLSFKEACQRLDKDLPTYQPFRPPVTRERKKESWKPHDPGDPPKLWRKKAGELVEYAHKKLQANAEQLAWLEKRGISMRSVEAYTLGWIPGRDGKDLFRPRSSWGVPDELKDNGQKKKLWIPRGLVIPLIVAGTVKRLRFRTVSGKPKYYVLPGSSGALLLSRTDARRIFVVESELDAILIDEHAGDQVAALALGSNTTKPDARAMAALEGASMVFNALDYDQAGGKAQKWWLETFPDQIRWPVPCGKDPGDAFAQGVDIREWVMSGVPGSGSGTGEKRQPERTWIKPLDGYLERKEPDPGSGIPKPLARLSELMSSAPVRINKAHGSVRLVENPRWERDHQEISREISRLIYLEPENFDYILNHPARVVDGINLLRGGK